MEIHWKSKSNLNHFDSILPRCLQEAQEVFSNTRPPFVSLARSASPVHIKRSKPCSACLLRGFLCRRSQKSSPPVRATASFLQAMGSMSAQATSGMSNVVSSCRPTRLQGTELLKTPSAKLHKLRLSHLQSRGPGSWHPAQPAQLHQRASSLRPPKAWDVRVRTG